MSILKIAILYFLFFFAVNGIAQTYYPFPESSAVWRQTQSSGDPFNPPVINNNYSLFINGDTIIDSASYSKLYFFNHFTGSVFNIDTVNSTYYGALREVNKRIYFYPDSASLNSYGFCYEWIQPSPLVPSEELLLYDFNAAVNDTIFYPHLDSSYIVITSIDSVLIQGQYRKRFNHTGAQNTSIPCGIFSGLHYVEGIGDITSGLFAHWMYFFENSELFRCYEDDLVSYSHFPNCMLPVGVKELFNKNDIKVYPNPTSNKLFLDFTDLNLATTLNVSLFDISGKKVHSSRMNQMINEIDVSNFNNGLYLLKIESDISRSSKLISIKK